VIFFPSSFKTFPCSFTLSSPAVNCLLHPLLFFAPNELLLYWPFSAICISSRKYQEESLFVSPLPGTTCGKVSPPLFFGMSTCHQFFPVSLVLGVPLTLFSPPRWLVWNAFSSIEDHVSCAILSQPTGLLSDFFSLFPLPCCLFLLLFILFFLGLVALSLGSRAFHSVCFVVFPPPPFVIILIRDPAKDSCSALLGDRGYLRTLLDGLSKHPRVSSAFPPQGCFPYSRRAAPPS